MKVCYRNKAEAMLPLKDTPLPFQGNILYVKNPEWAFTQILRDIETLNKQAPKICLLSAFSI